MCLTQEKIKKAKDDFRKVNFNDSGSGDVFFGESGHFPGNFKERKNGVSYDFYEKFIHYEILLEELNNDSPKIYKKIHKGNPFFFMAFLSFDIGYFEKGVFYMDAAMEEDRKRNPNNWKYCGAGSFMRLDKNGQGDFERIFDKIISSVLREVNRFNSIQGGAQIIKEEFVEKFVEKMIDEGANSIITSLYSFLLEYEERKKELILSGEGGGSVEPVLTYLFKGGLIFESLLKNIYKPNTFLTIGDFFSKNVIFGSDFTSEFKRGAKNPTFQDIVNSINDDSLNTSFNAIIDIRNGAGHDLVCGHIFTENDFEKLYKQQVNAIFYLIQKKFL